MNRLSASLLPLLLFLLPSFLQAAESRVVLATSKGEITILLDHEKAPVTVNNFLNYVEQGHYDNTIFHRVIPGFMIQGGGYESTLKERDTGDPIVNEASNGLKNTRGTLAMARTSDINSATAQFFINTVDNAHLDHAGPQQFGYAVFGRVVDGMSVVDAIEMVKTGTVSGFRDVPLEPVLILSARILSDD